MNKKDNERNERGTLSLKDLLFFLRTLASLAIQLWL